MVKWTLKEYLEANDVSAYALIKAASLSPNTVYGMTRGEHERISLEVLDKLLAGLEQLTGQEVEISDFLKREVVVQHAQVDPEDRAWLDSDLSRLGEYEPYDWGDANPKTMGEPLRLRNA